MTHSTRPLVVTADGPLLDEVLGVASAAGAAMDVAVDLGAARPQWRDAPVVLVGGDLASGLRDARLPPRRGVLLIHTDRPPTTERPVDDLVEGVLVVPQDEDALLARLAATTAPVERATTIAVLAGRGGAGASTLAAALAMTAADRGDPAWLLDLDPLGGGIDAVLGAELDPGVLWSGLSGTVGRLAVQALADAVPHVRGVRVVSCDDRTADLPVRSVLTAAASGPGTVVLDLPRHPTAARSEALEAAHRLVVVVPAEVRAILAARQVVSSLEHSPARVDLAVREVRDGLPAAEVSRAVGLPLAGVVSEESAVRTAGLTGSADELLSGSLLRLCQDLLAEPARASGRAA